MGEEYGAHQREVRVSELRRRVGRVSTGGKAAVAIIFDHGVVNFRDIIFPELQRLGLRATLALNSRMFDPELDYTEDTGTVTWADVQAWAAAGIEIANHSATHRGKGSVAEITDEIVAGREELEAAVGVPVDSWVQPGFRPGDPDYLGFGHGASAEAYYTTHAGRTILDAHAVATGTIFNTGYTWPLDGTIPIGPSGTWLDSGNTSGVMSTVTRAVTRTERVLLRSHPGYIGDAGMITAPQMVAFLEQLASRRDTGELVVLPLREWAIASA